MDYPLAPGLGASNLNHHKGGWAGLGCTLIQANVFTHVLFPPWFRTDVTGWVDENGHHKEANIKSPYGGQDKWLFYTLRREGIRVVQVDGKCEHLRVDYTPKGFRIRSLLDVEAE